MTSDLDTGILRYSPKYAQGDAFAAGVPPRARCEFWYLFLLFSSWKRHYQKKPKQWHFSTEAISRSVMLYWAYISNDWKIDCDTEGLNFSTPWSHQMESSGFSFPPHKIWLRLRPDPGMNTIRRQPHCKLTERSMRMPWTSTTIPAGLSFDL